MKTEKTHLIVIQTIVGLLFLIVLVRCCGDTSMYDARTWIELNSKDATDKSIRASIDSATVLFGLTPSQKVDLYRRYYIKLVPDTIPAPKENYDAE